MWWTTYFHNTYSVFKPVQFNLCLYIINHQPKTVTYSLPVLGERFYTLSIGYRTIHLCFFPQYERCWVLMKQNYTSSVRLWKCLYYRRFKRNLYKTVITKYTFATFIQKINKQDCVSGNASSIVFRMCLIQILSKTMKFFMGLCQSLQVNVKIA